ncbi:glycosyltransferase [Rubripirellula sp.]|nr:glycosyltransferase [Rubripirellula sp.]MDB4621396.1 glycosyltransferase [Rubripirellula sp.]
MLTARRGAEKAWQWCTSRKSMSSVRLPDGLSVKNPIMWPWMQSKSTRAVNSRLLTRQLQSNAKNSTVITTLPITADLVGRLSAKRWIYYCVDDFSVWPGLSGAVLREMELELISKADCVIAVSDHLVDAIRPYKSDVQLLTHGVDVDFWKCNESIQRVVEPTALFWGVVDRRMEAEWLLALANALTKEKIVLAGPQQDPDPRILQHPKIEAIGPVPMTELPKMAAAANVLIMPYADLPVTRAMQPLKFKEYIATGRPVVTSSLPAVQPWGQYVKIVKSQAEFVQSTLQHLNKFEQISLRSGDLQLQLDNETWEQKTRLFEEMIAI